MLWVWSVCKVRDLDGLKTVMIEGVAVEGAKHYRIAAVLLVAVEGATHYRIAAMLFSLHVLGRCRRWNTLKNRSRFALFAYIGSV